MFLDHFCVKPHLTLQTPLGEWTTTPRLNWHAYYDPSLHTVVIKTANKWRHHRTISKFRRHWIIDKQKPIFDSTPPEDLDLIQPLDILRQNAHQYTVSLPVPVPLPRSIPISKTWSHYVHNLHQWDQSILKEYHSDVPTIWQEIVKCDRQWDIITDASYSKNTAAYAWLINAGTNIIFTGKGQVTGNPLTAFRAELYAVMVWHCVLYHVMKYLDLTTSITVTPHTDNATVIQYYETIQNNTILQLSYVDDYDIYIR